MSNNSSALPELNLRVLILGLILSVVMGSANVYLGLKFLFLPLVSYINLYVFVGLLHFAHIEQHDAGIL